MKFSALISDKPNIVLTNNISFTENFIFDSLNNHENQELSSNPSDTQREQVRIGKVMGFVQFPRVKRQSLECLPNSKAHATAVTRKLHGALHRSESCPLHQGASVKDMPLRVSTVNLCACQDVYWQIKGKSLEKDSHQIFCGFCRDMKTNLGCWLGVTRLSQHREQMMDGIEAQPEGPAFFSLPSR